MKVVYFAWVREQIGVAEEEVTPPEGTSTVTELMAHLATLSPAHNAIFEKPDPIRVAINQEHVDHKTELSGVEEIAFFPPMTGG